jgi:predicted negative regulator of RcsB-dependent stress response
MTTIIIILGFVFYFGYKIYNNFKAEMEKAKQRAEQQKQKVNTSSNTEMLGKFNAQEHLDSIKEEAKKRKSVLDAIKNKKIALDYYNPEIPAEEVLSNRLIHEPHHHEFKGLKVEQVDNLEIKFDLRQAIIQSAILERPQY